MASVEVVGHETINDVFEFQRQGMSRLRLKSHPRPDRHLHPVVWNGCRHGPARRHVAARSAERSA